MCNLCVILCGFCYVILCVYFMCNLHWYFSAKENISFWHHSYIFNINVKYTLHLVQPIIQINRQDTKEKLQTDGQMVFYCFSVRCPFLTNQTLKEKYTYCTGSRILYHFSDNILAHEIYIDFWLFLSDYILL